MRGEAVHQHRLQLFLEGSVHLFSALLGRALDLFEEIVELVGLPEKTLGREPPAFKGGLDGTVPRQHDDLEGGLNPLERSQRLDAVHPRHPEIEDSDVEDLLFDRLDSALPSSHSFDDETPLLEALLEVLDELFFIIDEEDADRFVAHGTFTVSLSRALREISLNQPPPTITFQTICRGKSSLDGPCTTLHEETSREELQAVSQCRYPVDLQGRSASTTALGILAAR
jgi:hypothetical protein